MSEIRGQAVLRSSWLLALGLLGGAALGWISVGRIASLATLLGSVAGAVVAACLFAFLRTWQRRHPVADADWQADGLLPPKHLRNKPVSDSDSLNQDE